MKEAEKLSTGQGVEGTVWSRVPFGVFVDLGDNRFGLLKTIHAHDDPHHALPDVGVRIRCVIIDVTPGEDGPRFELSRLRADFERFGLQGDFDSP